MKKFKARLTSEDPTSLFIEVPFDVKAEFGKARLPVRISINGYAYRTTVAVYGGKYLLAVRREHRDAAGVKVGDLVNVTLEPDTEARVVETPPELAAELAKAKNRKAKAAWAKLSYSHQKEHAEAIADAKKPETRARRVAKAIAMLSGAGALIVAALTTSSPASAFCGFYVSGAEAKLSADATQVVLMREGTRTVLSMQNDYQGPPERFAMVVPVPIVLAKENVKVLPKEIFDKVDKLGAPRLVEYWEQDPCPPPGNVGSSRVDLQACKLEYSIVSPK